MRRRARPALHAAGRRRSGFVAAACAALLDFQLSAQGPLLRITAWTGLPEAMRSDTRRTMTRLGERFATLVIDGMADGSLRVVDPSIAAQAISGMLNAAAEVERWAPGIDAGNLFDFYARPLFTGLLARPVDPGRRRPSPSTTGNWSTANWCSKAATGCCAVHRASTAKVSSRSAGFHWAIRAERCWTSAGTWRMAASRTLSPC